MNHGAMRDRMVRRSLTIATTNGGTLTMRATPEEQRTMGKTIRAEHDDDGYSIEERFMAWRDGRMLSRPRRSTVEAQHQRSAMKATARYETGLE